jgi:hypothetical protein
VAVLTIDEHLDKLFDLAGRMRKLPGGEEFYAALYDFNQAIVPPQPILGGPRSSKWTKTHDAHLEKNPTCLACGTNENPQVHHIKPFHLFPELELEPTNLVTLCMKPYHYCHFVFGHAWNWSTNNPNVFEDAKRYFELKGRLRG